MLKDDEEVELRCIKLGSTVAEYENEFPPNFALKVNNRNESKLEYDPTLAQRRKDFSFLIKEDLIKDTI